MKTFKAKSGPFSERPFYSDSDLERIYVSELSAVGLLPSAPEPIRIDRFIEKRFKVVPSYQNGEGVLGLTRFTSQGVAEIIISKQLDDQGSEVAERRIRTTLGHEGGHGLLHTHLFVLAANEQPLFGDFSDPRKPKILCRDEKSSGPGYTGAWWEYQANKAMGSLLMPEKLVIEAARPFLRSRGSLGVQALAQNERQRAVRELSEIFDVNPAVARIRLEQIYPEGGEQLEL